MDEGESGVGGRGSVWRDTIIYCTCTFLLGLIIGSLLIGPHLTKPSAAPAIPPATQQNPMDAVRQQIASLKETIARDPNNVEALLQLGNMYMDAAKYPEAIGYYERALAIHEDPNIRVDLGICYKQSGQLDQSLAAFRRAGEEAPGQWQPLFNEATVLGEMHRFSEAKTILAKLKAMRPDDPEVQRLEQALARAR